MSRGPRDAIRGCLLGGAVGDALGAPVEFWTWDRIVARYGADGPSELGRAFGVAGAVTDDTQMTLFTAEGLLRADHRWATRGICSTEGVVLNAYLRWLRTQDEPMPTGPAPESPPAPGPSWLLGHAALWSKRAPGDTCLTALREHRAARDAPPGEAAPSLRARNTSKGCGGVMRVAPVGLVARDPERAFTMGAALAALTHGHPTGQIAAGAFAAAVAHLRLGDSVPDALDAARTQAARANDGGETADALDRARDLAGGDLSDAGAVAAFGTVAPAGGPGWVAEEALAVAALCARRHPNDMERALRAAVTHSGDSDSTGAICGNLLGAALGDAAVPARWLDALELRDVITQIADDLDAMLRYPVDSWTYETKDPGGWPQRYPPS